MSVNLMKLHLGVWLFAAMGACANSLQPSGQASHGQAGPAEGLSPRSDDGTGAARPGAEPMGPSAPGSTPAPQDSIDEGLDPKGDNSVESYRKTVYPLVTDWCVSCHADIKSPFFAAKDVEQAHEAVLLRQIVDFTNPDRSRLYLRLVQDKHNCPNIGCEPAGKQMLEALQAWSDASDEQNQEASQLTSTSAHRFAEAQEQTVPGKNPEGVMLFEAERFTLKAPMQAAAVPAASGGQVIETPANAGSVVNLQTATASQTLGTARMNFEVKTAGSFRIQGLVNGAAAANASFYVRIDAGALSPWVFAPTAAAYAWTTAAPTAAGTPTQFTLAAGAHTLEIRQRQAAAKIDKVVISSVPTFDPANAQPATLKVKLLSFDLAPLTKIAGARLTVEVSDYSQNAYLFKNPSLVVPSGSLHAKDLRLLINGISLPQHATYTAVDKTVSAPGGLLSSAALVALKDKGTAEDEFSFAFGTLETK